MILLKGCLSFRILEILSCMAVKISMASIRYMRMWAGLKGTDGGNQSGPAKRQRTEAEKAERLRRTIFVGNLPVKVKAKLIKQAFSQ